MLCFGLLQDGDVRVGVFPEGEEILIGSTGFGSVALQNIGTCETKMGESTQRAIRDETAMVEEFLKFPRGLAALLKKQIRLGAQISWMKKSTKFGVWERECLARRGLQLLVAGSAPDVLRKLIDHQHRNVVST